MNKSNEFSPEVHERAVRMVQEHRGEYPSLWAAIESIAPEIGCVAQTLNEWVKRDEIDNGGRAGVTTTDLQRLKELERENKELRRANEIRSSPVRFLPRRSSTADSSPEGLHRQAPRHSRGRADLQGSADRPVGIPKARSPSPQPGTALRSRSTRRSVGAADRARLEGQHASLWRRQGLATTRP